MKALRTLPWLSLVLLGIMTVYQLWGVRFIPFHPDEVHLLYQSRDFELLATRPTSMAWQPGTLADYYRATVAPLPKYILGLGRFLFGHPSASVSVDWDWSKTWEENRQLGALPSAGLLWAARFSVSLLLPLSMVFLYLGARAISSESAAIVAVILFGTNALILLHARRAMAEGILLLGVTLTIWGLTQGDRQPWLVALGVAVAINAKHSAIVLLPAGLLAVIWLPKNTPRYWVKAAKNLAQYLGIITVLFYLLNPFIWKHPFTALKTMRHARQEWVRLQISTLESVGRPDLVLQEPTGRIASTLFNIFVNPPLFREVGNYAQDTAASEAVYQAVPGHRLFRGLLWGGILLVLALFGFLLAGLDSWRIGLDHQRAIFLLILATILQFTGLVGTVFLSTQRYVVPLIPFVCLWVAYSLYTLEARLSRKALKNLSLRVF